MTIKFREKFDELAMLELFWSEPVITNPADGYWCYEVTDSLSTILRFGLNIIHQSVQVEIKTPSASILNLVFENVEGIEIIDTEKGEFTFTAAPNYQEMHAKVQVRLRPQIKIRGYASTNNLSEK